MFTIETIQGSDGYNLRYYKWDKSDADDVIFFIHGFMSHSLWMEPQLTALNSLGYKVIGIDRRGAGINTEKLGDAPSVEQLLNDHERIVSHESQGKTIHVWGWCLGAVLALNYVQQTEQPIDSIIASAPILFPSALLRKRAEEMGARPKKCTDISLDAEQTAWLPLAVQEEDFTKGPSLKNFILKDNRRLKKITPRFYEIQRKLGQAAWVKLLSQRYQTPTLVILAERDAIVDNELTIKSFTSVDSAVIKSIDSEHGIQFEKGDELVEMIYTWIKDRREKNYV